MKLKPLLQDFSVRIYVFLLAIILGGTVYQTLVIIPEFTRDMPNSMIALANSEIIPGKFWGSPILLLGGLLMPIITVIINWKTPRRKWLLLAFGFGMTASISTSVYFFPRLQIMGLLDGPPSTDIPLLIRTIKEWVFADQFRFWLTVVPAFFMALKAATVPTAKKAADVVKGNVQVQASYAA